MLFKRVNQILGGDKMPTIRKVFRQGDSFICGICKTKHDRQNKAYECLSKCWQETMKLYPLVKRQFSKLGPEYYRCRFCCRDYESEAEGLRCVEQCKSQWLRLVKKEQELFDLSDEFVRSFTIKHSLNAPLKRKTIPRYNLRAGLLVDDSDRSPGRSRVEGMTRRKKRR